MQQQTMNIYLLVGNELDLGNSKADVLGGSSHADHVGRVIRLGDKNSGRRGFHDLLDDFALFSDQANVQLLGDDKIEAGLKVQHYDIT